MQTIILRIVLVLGLILGGTLTGYLTGRSGGSAAATLKCAGEQASEVTRIQGERDEIQTQLNEVSARWAASQKGAQGTASGTVDRLTESNVRLRVKLADTTIEAVQGYNRGKSDGKAELHRETSEALIELTQDADRQVEALQDSLRAVTK